MTEDIDWSGQPAGKDEAGYYRILTDKQGNEKCENCGKQIQKGEKHYITNEQLSFEDGDTNIETSMWCKKCFIKHRVIQDL